tara:strand:+ start:46 stop:621 length:576 start_codon:yes stop_codon:yes gene_type:complete
MNRLLLIFILVFSIQNLTKADDIKDFQIAGMSIGDSALDFFTKKEINNNKSYMYNNKKYAASYQDLENNIYEGVQFEFKDNDDRFLIKSLGGKIFYKNINNCYAKEEMIVKSLTKIFKNKSEYKDHGISKHQADSSGKSKGTWHTFFLDDGSGHISIECMDWDKEMNYSDSLKVSIISYELNQFLLNEAYK